MDNATRSNAKILENVYGMATTVIDRLLNTAKDDDILSAPKSAKELDSFTEDVKTIVTYKFREKLNFN